MRMIIHEIGFSFHIQFARACEDNFTSARWASSEQCTHALVEALFRNSENVCRHSESVMRFVGLRTQRSGWGSGRDIEASAKLNQSRSVWPRCLLAVLCWLTGIVKEMRWSAMCLGWRHAVACLYTNNEVSINVCMHVVGQTFFLRVLSKSTSRSGRYRTPAAFSTFATTTTTPTEKP